VLFCVVEHRPDAVPLGELLNRKGWLDGKVAAGNPEQNASALSLAHQLCILHLPLTPKWQLFASGDWVVVCEFGIGIERGAQRLQPSSAPYTSPELAMRQMVDHRSDLYSLGAVLYQMLTDRTVFDSEDADYIRRKQASFVPSPPHMISPDVPESLSRV